MGLLRAAGARLMAKGVLGSGWYAVLTGLALLYVAWLLGSLPPGDDAAAPYVAIALAATGLWQLGSGLRVLFRPTPGSTDETS